MSVLDSLKGIHASRHRTLRGVYRVLHALWSSWRFLTSPERRWQTLTAVRFGKAYFQRSTTTASGRYPDIYELCRQNLVDVDNPRLMSFGCSTGEEASDLSRLIPTSTVVGVDINPWCLEQARRRFKNDRVRFVARTSTEFERLRGFDAIFCMAVLQRTENRTRWNRTFAKGFTFEQFELELGVLDSKLRKGGLLIIEHTDFDFRETRYAKRYDVLPDARNLDTKDRPLYGADNQIRANTQSLHRCFVKRMD